MAGRTRRGDLLAYQTKHDAFLRELRQFHSSRGTAFNRPPRINGREVDLYLLYSEVTSLGGWKKVNNNKSWPTVLELLHIPKDCPNATFAIRHFYIRYLDQYERIHFHGEESDDDRSEAIDVRGRKSHVSAQHLPTSYNHQQHDLTDAMRAHLGLTVDAVTQSEYDKLVFSFLSGLPNEVDFAINVCTLLANDSRRCLHLERCPRLLELLIAQAGVWGDSSSGLCGLLEEEWQKLEGKWSMSEFWLNVLEDQDIKELLGPLEGKGNSAAQEDNSLFNLRRHLGIRDREGQRVLQIAAILRNLAFEDSNVPILASSPVCLKFLLLCAHCTWANLRQLAFDTLGSLTTEMVLDPSDDLSTQILFRTITSSLQSNDRFLIIRGLEMLIGLCQVETNEDAIVRSLEHRVYERICALLTIPDIMLLVYTLECLYYITQLGKEPCNIIARIKGVIGILVGLVSLEAQTFGPNACISMKLVESPTLSVNPVSLTPINPPRPTMQSSQRIVTSHGQRSISIPIPPGYQELDNETFVCNWLKATYETRPNNYISHTSIYNEYQNVCIRLGKKGLIGPTQLANHLRTVFPCAIQKKVEGSSNSFEWESLRKREHPLAVSIITPIKSSPKTTSNLSQPLPELSIGKSCGPTTNSSHSPILKAQLSAPPKSPVLRQHPHLHKALVTSPNPSSPPPPPPAISPIKEPSSTQTPTTLIKSLLANKVSQNIQRQQQQQILKQQTVPVITALSDKPFVLQPPQLPQLLLTVTSVTTAAVTTATTTVTSTSSSPQVDTKVKVETDGVTPPRVIAPKIESRLALFCPKVRLNGAQRQINAIPVERGKTVIVENLKNGGTEQSRTSEVVSTTSTSNTPPSIFKCQQLTSAQNSGNNPFATLPPNLQPSQSPVNRKGGVLADLLDGKVNKEALLVMNGVIDRRSPSVTPPSPSLGTTVIKMTNGEGPTTHSLSTGNTVVSEEKTFAAPVVTKDNALLKPIVNEVKLGPGIVRTVVNRFPNLTAETQINKSDDLIGYPRVSYEQLKQLNQKVSTFAVVKRPLIVKPISQSSTVNNDSNSVNSDGVEVKRLKVDTSCNAASPLGEKKTNLSSTLTVQKVAPILGSTITPTKVVPLSGVGQQLQLQKQQQLQQQQQQQTQPKSPLKPLQPVQQPRPPVTPRLEFICDWKDCKKSFDTPNSVYFHACKVHTPANGPAASPCLWENCDQMVRQRLSLMTHIQERHCNEGVLRLQARRRQEMSTAGQSSIPHPPPPPPHPGYAPNAALHAIKRHALEFLNNKEMTEEEKEGPVTKCIRLTAVLVLRNLSRHSSTGRRLIQRHEAFLASVAISNVEAAGSASHCLAFLTFPPKEASQVTR